MTCPSGVITGGHAYLRRPAHTCCDAALARARGAAIISAALVALSCGRSPAGPSTDEASVGISDGTARFLNFASVCTGNDVTTTGPVIDEVSFAYRSRGFNIVGATVTVQETVTLARTTGVVSDDCPPLPLELGIEALARFGTSPYCSQQFAVCRTGGRRDPTSGISSGAIRVYTHSEWRPTTTYRVQITSPVRSTELSVALNRSRLPQSIAVRNLTCQGPFDFCTFRADFPGRIQFGAEAVYADGVREDIRLAAAHWRSSNGPCQRF